jgi:hypothetical protein
MTLEELEAVVDEAVTPVFGSAFCQRARHAPSYGVTDGCRRGLLDFSRNLTFVESERPSEIGS